MIVAFRVITGTSVHFLTTFHSLKISIKKFLQSLSNERICKIHHEKNPDHRSSFSITGHISIALGYAFTT